MHRIWNEEAGLELSEYAVLLALIILVVLAAALAMQDGIVATFERVAAAFERVGDTPAASSAAPQKSGHGKGRPPSRPGGHRSHSGPPGTPGAR